MDSASDATIEYGPDMVNNIIKHRMLRWATGPGDYPTPIKTMTFHRREDTNIPENCFYEPIVGLTIQGSKRTIVGTKEYRYGKNHCIVSGVDLPSINYITNASSEKPYLVVSMRLDNQLTTQLAAKIRPSKPYKGSIRGTVVAPTDPNVLKAFLRLINLLDTPEQIPVLAPIIIHEIHFRLLTGPQGELLRAINTVGAMGNQIFRVITWIRQNFKAPLEVDVLAQKVHMSPPTFRKHFKSITTMSPTQYLKRLRLYEAQRLMLEEKADAAHVSHEVGYESPTQFYREYKRLFGAPPLQNVNQLR